MGFRLPNLNRVRNELVSRGGSPGWVAGVDRPGWVAGVGRSGWFAGVGCRSGAEKWVSETFNETYANFFLTF